MDGHAWGRGPRFGWLLDGLVGIAILAATTALLVGLAALAAVLIAWLAD